MDPLPATLAAIPVLRPDGTSLALGSQWAAKPVVLVMLRHFG